MDDNTLYAIIIICGMIGNPTTSVLKFELEGPQ